MNPPNDKRFRQYEKLWLEIAKADHSVQISCHTNYAATVIQAVRKEKARFNVMRKQLGIPRYGILTVNKCPHPKDPRKVQITFSLAYNGDKL